MTHMAVQVVVVGLGTVGQALLDLLHHFASEFEVIAIVNSTHLWTEPLHIQSLLKDPFLKNSKDPSFLLGQPYQLDFLSALPTSTLPKVILDCTASSTLPNHYPTWLNSGYFIVTANKKGLAGPIGLYDACSPFISSTFYYESTVGAGLPIIATLIDLIQSHDKIYRIEGVLSGSLSFLFNQDLKENVTG
ncbi:hypothetical protein HMI55_006840 [Coelomomyces lativittatus]|nr:hypothetical protein HMI55_006840 [Coelomomyces lativittatus]